MASRFADLNISIDEFIKQQKKSENTKRETEQNLPLLNQFLRSKNEKRSILDITPTELNFYLSEFIQVSNKLRTKFFARFDSQLRKAFKTKNYGL